MLNKLTGLAALCAAVLIVSACGGGGGGASGGGAGGASTTNVTTTVIDGAIQGAKVCLDTNTNGACDPGELQGTTDSAGKITLAVPNADVGKYPIVAEVVAGSVDADNGTVTVPYKMMTPADQTGVVSPLTTMVQQAVQSAGLSTADAVKVVQAATGITVSLFQDFTKSAAPADGTPAPATVARMIVVATQAQAGVVQSSVGTTALDNSTITQAMVDAAVQQHVSGLLPSIVNALTNPAVIAATTPAAKEAALLAAVSNSFIALPAMPTVVAINNQISAGPGTSTAVTTPTAGFNLDTLNFSDLSNWSVRTLGGSVVQQTPDAQNNVKYVERRARSNAGVVTQWGFGNNPQDGSNLAWDGAAWIHCPVNFENTNSVRDAKGNSNYRYCGRASGSSTRASLDVSGQSMVDVYNQIIAAKYDNLQISSAASVLGAAVFPADSKVFYQSNTSLSESPAYYPGSGNVVTHYSTGIQAGGDARGVPTHPCNSTEYQSPPAIVTSTLEDLVTSFTGSPCIFNTSSFVANGITYYGDFPSENWGQASLSLGSVLGSVAINSTPTGFYTGNTLLRMAFKGIGVNPVTYYACKQRFTNGSTRNCTEIGAGSYSISTVGDARVMTMTNMPLATSPYTSDRVWVERGGKVYYGYQPKQRTTNRARLNTIAAAALLAQLGMPAVDVAKPWALTATSYQGIWDMRDVANTAPIAGISVNYSATGAVACTEANQPLACTFSISNPATGAFLLTITADGTTVQGNLNFLTGDVTGTFNDPTTVPSATGNVTGQRR